MTNYVNGKVCNFDDQRLGLKDKIIDRGLF